MIWKNKLVIDQFNANKAKTMVEHLGIEIVEIGEDFLIGKMPVDERTIQFHGALHGGASVTLAETLGSLAAQSCLKHPLKQAIMGIEINANHLSPATNGFVFGKVTPVKIGNRLQIWRIEITDQNNILVCVSRLTTITVNKS